MSHLKDDDVFYVKIGRIIHQKSSFPIGSVDKRTVAMTFAFSMMQDHERKTMIEKGALWNCLVSCLVMKLLDFQTLAVSRLWMQKLPFVLL